MYIIPKSIAAPKSPQIAFTPVNTLDGGVDYVNKEWKLSANKTNNSKNMWFKEGEIGKRFGQDLLSYIGSQPIISSYKFLFEDKFIVHYGDKLLEIDPN